MAWTILNPSTLPNVAAGGYLTVLLKGQSGRSPYSWALGSVTGPDSNVYVDEMGWLMILPSVSSGTYSIPVTGYDITGAAQTITFSCVIDNHLMLGGIDPETGLLNLPPARKGQKYRAYVYAYGGSGTGFNFTVASGALPTGLSITTTTFGVLTVGKISGTPTHSGNPICAIEVTDSASHVASASINLNISSALTASRPVGNTGSGFFVSGQHLFDPNGTAVPPGACGLNRNHFDAQTWNGSAMGALATPTMVRDCLNFAGTTSATQSYLTAEYLDNDILPIPVVFGVSCTFTASIPGGGTTMHVTAIAAASTTNCGVVAVGLNLTGAAGKITAQLSGSPGGVGDYTVDTPQTVASGTISGNIGNTSGYSDPTVVQAAVQTIIQQSAGLLPIQNTLIVNIGNEWSPLSAAVWESTYISAVTALRAAGFLCPLLIDGPDYFYMLASSAAVLAADPQKNCLFAFHGYGETDNTRIAIAGVTKASPAVISLDFADASPSTHPFGGANGGFQWDIINPSQAPGYTGITPHNNSFNGNQSWLVSGVGGMTAINGALATTGTNPLGGVQGSSPYSLTMNGVNSSAYGSATPNTGYITDGAYFDNVAKLLGDYATANGVCFILGEYGPGRNIWPDPTVTTVGQYTTAWAARGMIRTYWAWDDHDNGNGSSSNNWFGCTNSPTGGAGWWQGAPSGLTEQGSQIVLNPRYGLRALAAPPSSFLP